MNEPSYPPTSFSFNLSLTGSEELNTSFQEASGIDYQFTTEEIWEGGEKRFVHRLPGQEKDSNLVLKRGVNLKDSEIVRWRQEIFQGGLNSEIKVKNISVSLLDIDGEVLMRWNFENAYPVSWSVSYIDSLSNEIAIESLEFAYSYFTTDENLSHSSS